MDAFPQPPQDEEAVVESTYPLDLRGSGPEEPKQTPGEAPAGPPASGEQTKMISCPRQQHSNQLSIIAFVNSDETGKVLPRQGSGFPGRAASSRPVGEPGSRCPSLLLSTPAPPPATKPSSPEPCSSPGCVSVWICIPTLGKKGGRNWLLPVSVTPQTCQLALRRAALTGPLVPAFSSLPCTVPACPCPLSSLFSSPLSSQVDSVCLPLSGPDQPDQR